MNSARLTSEQAWSILEQSNVPDWVLGHSAKVAKLAVAMADRAAGLDLEIDHELVEVGAILHDVGRSVTQGIRHAGLGADLLRGRGIARPVVEIVERHTGAGIDEEEARALGLPVRDYTPRTLAQKLVAHADNLYSGPRRLTMANVEAKYKAKGLDRAWHKIEALHLELCACLQCDLERLAD